MALRYGNMPTPPALRLVEHGAKEFAAKALLLRAPPRTSLIAAPLSELCFARVSCSLHRLCRVLFLAPSQHGRTALHYAAKNGHVAAMEFLLANSADPNFRDVVRALLGT